MVSINQRRQNGMTGLGWLLALVIFGFFVLLILRLAPIYLDHYTVKSTIESLKSEPLITQKSVAEIKTMLKKRLNINYVSSINVDDIEIKKSPGIIDVNLEYDVKVPIVGNISALVSFSEKLQLVGN